MTLPGSRFDVWSCTKSFTGTAWGLLLEEGRKGTLPNNLKIDLDSPAYSFLPDKVQSDRQTQRKNNYWSFADYDFRDCWRK